MQSIKVITKVTRNLGDNKSDNVGNQLVKVTGGEKPRLVVDRADVPASFDELSNVLQSDKNISGFIATVYEDYSLAGIQGLKNEFSKLIAPDQAKVDEFLEKMKQGILNFTPISLVQSAEKTADKARKADTVKDLLARGDLSPEQKLAMIQAAMAA